MSIPIYTVTDIPWSDSMSDETPSLSIRAATQEDAEELARLYGIFDDRLISKEQILRRLEAVHGIETAFLAIGSRRAHSRAEISGHPEEYALGMVSVRVGPCLSTDALQAQITEFYVARDYQGFGIEQTLLEKVETLASERGAEEITLLTGVRNAAAQSLFRNLGYRDYALAMRKHLR
jgi:ribosomal protein S18 acetylase RimI-like enzyme